MQQCVGVQVPMPAPASAQSPLNFVSGNSQRLLPKTAFAPLRLLPNPKQFGFGFVFYYLADFVSLATAFFRSEQTPSRTHSAAPPFQIEPAALGFNLGFYFCAQSVRLRFRQQPEAIAENCAHFLAPPSKSEALGFGFVFSLLFTDLSVDKQSIVSLLIAVLGAALVKKHDFLATTQRARVVDIILQAEHSSSMVETRKYSKA